MPERLSPTQIKHFSFAEIVNCQAFARWLGIVACVNPGAYECYAFKLDDVSHVSCRC